MSLKIRIRSNLLAGDGSQQTSVYRYRPQWFAVSIILHSIAVLGLGLIRPQDSISTKRPIYDEVIQPQEHKIVWYDFRKPELPDVDAAQRIGTFPKPRGKELSRQVIIRPRPERSRRNNSSGFRSPRSKSNKTCRHRI
jgi:hypothetical protein